MLLSVLACACVPRAAAMAWPPGKAMAQRMFTGHVQAWSGLMQGFEEGWKVAAPDAGGPPTDLVLHKLRAPPASIPSLAPLREPVRLQDCPCGQIHTHHTSSANAATGSANAATAAPTANTEWCVCECHPRRGRCTYWNDKRGFGFIQIANGQGSTKADDIFVHYTDITHRPSYRSLYVGEVLEFQLARHEESGKRKAMHVAGVEKQLDAVDNLLDELMEI